MATSPAHNLPKDDGEFYQFCYVSSTGHVRGASTPFQFKKPSADDFITIEDEEDGMMVVKSKTVALEEDLVVAVREKEKLQRVRFSVGNSWHNLYLQIMFILPYKYQRQLRQPARSCNPDVRSHQTGFTTWAPFQFTDRLFYQYGQCL